MLIGGLQKTSLLDYPGKVSCIVFTVGCNFNCGFCYNKQLIKKNSLVNLIPQEEFFSFLKKRKKIVDAVVITGGEPVLQKDLEGFIAEIKNLGLLVKLDTNGTKPGVLRRLIDQKLLDYIAMDIKAPLSGYKRVSGSRIDEKRIVESIEIIMSSGVDYEFRSTILPKTHSKEDLIEMSQLIHGAKKYYLQKFLVVDSLNKKSFSKLKPYTDQEMKELAELCARQVEFCGFR